MKKKGFTLIEIVAVITIISTSLLIGNVSKKYYEDYKCNLEDKILVEEIIGGINRVRELAMVREKNGKLTYDKKRRIIEIKISEVIKLQIKIPEHYEVLLNEVINIKKDGSITAGSFNLENKKNKKSYSIRIGVGMEIIRLYEKG